MFCSLVAAFTDYVSLLVLMLVFCVCVVMVGILIVL